MFEDDPRFRSVACQTNTSSNCVWCILQEENPHPFCLHKVKSLLPEDLKKSELRSVVLGAGDVVDPNFLIKVLFTERGNIFQRQNIQFQKQPYLGS